MQHEQMHEEKGFKMVKDIVSEWSKVYISQVFFIEQYQNVWK